MRIAGGTPCSFGPGVPARRSDLHYPHELETSAEFREPPLVRAAPRGEHQSLDRPLEHAVQRRIDRQLLEPARQSVRTNDVPGELAADVELAAQEREILLHRTISVRQPTTNGDQQLVREQSDEHFEQIVALCRQQGQLAVCDR